MSIQVMTVISFVCGIDGRPAKCWWLQGVSFHLIIYMEMNSFALQIASPLTKGWNSNPFLFFSSKIIGSSLYFYVWGCVVTQLWSKSGDEREDPSLWGWYLATFKAVKMKWKDICIIDFLASYINIPLSFSLYSLWECILYMIKIIFFFHVKKLVSRNWF